MGVLTWLGVVALHTLVQVVVTSVASGVVGLVTVTLVAVRSRPDARSVRREVVVLVTAHPG